MSHKYKSPTVAIKAKKKGKHTKGGEHNASRKNISTKSEYKKK